MGGYGALPTVVAWLSINLKGQTKRAVGVSFEIGMGNFGGESSKARIGVLS